MNGVFISYRRKDSLGSTTSIYRRLKKAFTEKDIFIDYISLKPGENWFPSIKKAINECKILLVVIDQYWLELLDKTEDLPFDPPQDYVRFEIKTGLERNILVIPILVDYAKMPSENALPQDIKGLTGKQGVYVRNTNLEQDMDSLIKRLRPIIEHPNTFIRVLIRYWNLFVIFFIVSIFVTIDWQYFVMDDNVKSKNIKLSDTINKSTKPDSNILKPVVSKNTQPQNSRRLNPLAIKKDSARKKVVFKSTDIDSNLKYVQGNFSPKIDSELVARENFLLPKLKGTHYCTTVGMTYDEENKYLDVHIIFESVGEKGRIEYFSDTIKSTQFKYAMYVNPDLTGGWDRGKKSSIFNSGDVLKFLIWIKTRTTFDIHFLNAEGTRYYQRANWHQGVGNCGTYQLSEPVKELPAR